jgi:hypothetical protein
MILGLLGSKYFALAVRMFIILKIEMWRWMEHILGTRFHMFYYKVTLICTLYRIIISMCLKYQGLKSIMAEDFMRKNAKPNIGQK